MANSPPFDFNQLVAIFTTSVKRLGLAGTAGVIACTLVLVYWLSRFQFWPPVFDFQL
jgi:hypothetical protein